MRQTVTDLCIECGKMTEHIRYCEDREFEWFGVMVPYTETGRICSICGTECQSTEEWDNSMAQIKENYRGIHNKNP